MRLSQTKGFTLVELMVVVAIILLLIAMILPAIQRVKETANKLECASHLRTIGQGIKLFTVTHGGYYPTGGGDIVKNPNIIMPPRGFLPAGEPSSGLTQDWGWMYQILPYVEQEPLWKLKINPSVDPNGIFLQIDQQADLQIATTTLSIYFCPSRRLPCLLNNPEIGRRAANDYAGNMGAFTPIFETGLLHEP